MTANPAALEYDIAIVGYGPVGAFTALLLAEAGLRIAVLERSREALELPRAVGLDGESVRAFQRIGLGDEIAKLLQPPREKDAVAFTNSKREPYFEAVLPPTGWNGWRDTAFFDQPELEARLRELVAAQPRIDVFLGRCVTAIAQNESDVTLDASDDDGAPVRVRATFAIGCDGASSFVREAAGIGWQSLGYDQDWLVVDILQGPGAELPLVTLQVCDPARLTTYVCVKDPNRRWEFPLLPGETREEMLRPETIERLLAPWVAPEHYEIRRAAVYQFHAATAERWQDGRIFLAGDAAHQTPPFLGQGLNAGFRDAVNLGWKIPLVLNGTCDRSLLETYEAERDAHAVDLVDWAVAIGKLMETLAAAEAGRPDPYPDNDRSSGYGQGRTAPPLRGGALLDEQAGPESPVGQLFRQPSVRDASGRVGRLDDHLGPGFAVVGRSAEDLAMGPEARSVVERLGVRCVDLSALEVTEGDFDPLLRDHPAAVVRPDRYVFGVVDEGWDLDRILTTLRRKMRLA